MTERRSEEHRLMRGIMLAVLVWGTILAVGAFLFGIDQEQGGIRFAPNPARGLITFAFVIGFLGFWKWQLSRRDRLARSAKETRDGPMTGSSTPRPS